MAITINGTGSITGLTAGGLPDGSVTNADLEYAGTSGQVLTSQGSGSAPQWVNASTPAAEVIAWVNYSSNGTIQDDVGISSITKGNSGYYTANLDTSQADDNYVAVGSNGQQSIHCATPGTSSISIIHIRRTDGAGVDHDGWIAAFR